MAEPRLLFSSIQNLVHASGVGVVPLVAKLCLGLHTGDVLVMVPLSSKKAAGTLLFAPQENYLLDVFLDGTLRGR